MGERYHGRIKWFNKDKGYGFIVRLDSNRDVFLHASKLPPHIDCPMEGQKVLFDVEQHDKGTRATNVEFVS